MNSEGNVADDGAIALREQKPNISTGQSAGKPLSISLADDRRRPIARRPGAVGLETFADGRRRGASVRAGSQPRHDHVAQSCSQSARLAKG